MAAYSKAWATMDMARWAKVRAEVVIERGGRCQDCGATHPLEVHHVRPLAKGGAPYAKSNLRLLCKFCHAHVGDTKSRKDFTRGVDAMRARR